MTWRSNRRTWIAVSIVLMAFVSPSIAKVIYVDANAPGPTHDGSSWTNAYHFLQDALADAGSSAKPVEIRVAQGIYTPDQGGGQTPSDRTATFQLTNNVTLKGGYASTGAPDPNARDIELYETILSGDLNGNDTDANSVWDLWGDPTRYDNSLHVVTGSGTDETAVLDGFTISDGYNEKTGKDGNGSGMINDNGSPTMTKCTFYTNCGRAGGGMSCEVGNPELTNCTFKMNFSSGEGGGIYIRNCSPILTGCVFIANASHNGAAMYNRLSNPNLINCTFYANEAGSVGGAMCTDFSSPLMSNCTFRENTSGIVAGGIFFGGGSPILTNCAFIKNSAPTSGGGAMVNGNIDLTLTNCTFSGNSAMSNSVMDNAHSTITLTNCILWNNTPPQIGDYNSTIVVTYSDIQGGWPGLGNIDADPCFVNPNNGDYHLKSQAGRWDPNSQSWLQDYVSSPCIDAANPGCPVGDEPSPNGNRRNMGAYGGTTEASKSPGNGRNIADLTNDWAVDSNDLKVFVSYWLQTGECIPGDFDRSQFVDFNDYGIFASQWSHKQDSVAIFIDSNTHSNLTSQIQRLKSDIINDLGVNVFIFSDNFDDIKQIKDIIIEKYNHAGLIGAILIGDIPTAYFEYQNSGSVPTDRYFQDLSDKFIDVDGDGKFEREYYMAETDVTMRDIWTGRIKPPVSGSEAIELLRNYLDRNHNYRTGNITYDRKMLYYGSVSINQGGMSQDDYNDLVNQIDDYTGLYDSDDDVNSIYHTDLEMQKRIYLTELKNSYDFVFVNIHGTPVHQWVGENSPGDQCVVYHYEIKEFRPQPFFSALASCSNGDFTVKNYFAGWYLFSGNSLIVQANSTVSTLVGASTVQFLKDYIPLGLGVTFGDMDKNDRTFMVSHILGDPTLTLRPKPTGDLPQLSRYSSEIDFGDVERGTIPEKYISFWNGGTAPLTISYKKARFSIDGEYVFLGYWDVFYYKHPNTGETFRDFDISPGKCKVVPFGFYPRADGPTGRYTMTILFQTNDPENPYMEIHLSGNAI
jgi:hypothetical protein